MISDTAPWTSMRIAPDGTGFTPGLPPADKANLWMALTAPPEPEAGRGAGQEGEDAPESFDAQVGHREQEGLTP